VGEEVREEFVNAIFQNPQTTHELANSITCTMQIDSRFHDMAGVDEIVTGRNVARNMNHQQWDDWNPRR
jgi:hypothetical protein